METSTRPPDDPSAAAEADATFATRGCCCFWVPWSSDRRSWEPVRAPTPPEAGGWWRRGVTALMKVREWSELAAGPRWKTFIRRFNRNPRLGGGGRRWAKYQYDPLSYALNFDEGRGQEESPEREAGAGGFRDFSSRYAATPGLDDNAEEGASMQEGNSRRKILELKPREACMQAEEEDK